MKCMLSLCRFDFYANCEVDHSRVPKGKSVTCLISVKSSNTSNNALTQFVCDYLCRSAQTARRL